MIRIEKPAEGQDVSGQPLTSWVLLAEVWAEWMPARGDERFEAQQLASLQAGSFRIRWRSDVLVTAKMRIRMGQRYFNILDAVELGRRVGLLLPVSSRSD